MSRWGRRVVVTLVLLALAWTYFVFVAACWDLCVPLESAR